MSFFRNRAKFKKAALILIISLSINAFSFICDHICAYADEITDPSGSDPAGSDPSDITSVSTPRIPGFSTVSSSVLSHTHRGSGDTQGECYTIPIIHSHSGNSSSGGSCYSPHYHSHSSSCYAHCSYHATGCSFYTSYPSYCTYHGNVESVTYTVYIAHYTCGKTEQKKVTIACPSCGGDPTSGQSGSHQYLTCSRGGSIEYYDMTCTKTEGETIDGYDPGCGLEVRDYGSVSLTNTTPEWTAGNVVLKGAIDDPEDCICTDGYGVMSFDTDSGEIADTTDSSITVSANGTYTMALSVDPARFDSAQASVMFTVSNIDRTDPVIDSVIYDTGEEWLHENIITVNASDLQPDGSAGSGLADEAYSFDGGITWQADNTYPCTQNGTIDICVRDYCGNTSSCAVEITNIDNDGPTAGYTYTPKTWYKEDGPRTFTITASDEQAGLAELPYSYDGGETWTDDAVIQKDTDGTFTVLIKDAMGNITELTIINKSDIKPSPSSHDDNQNIQTGDTDGSGDSDGSDSDTGIPKKTDPTKETTEPDADTIQSSSAGHNASGQDPDNTVLDPAADTGDDTSDYLNDDLTGQTVYFEQLPIASPPTEITRYDGYKDHIPFYKTRAFVAAVSVGGGLFGCGVLLFVMLLMYSGVIIYTFDGTKYRFTGIRPIRHSERGNYIRLSREFMETAYSGRYKFKLGYLYVKRHKDDLLLICANGDWTSVKVEKYAYTVIKNQTN